MDLDGFSRRAQAGIGLTRLDLPRRQGVNQLTADADGSFLLERTTPGRYRIEVSPATLPGPPQLGFIASLGDTELPGGEFAFDGAPTPLRVHLLSATASLSVQVAEAGGGAAWDAIVHVEPVNPALMVKAGATTDQNGNYQGLLPPGEYRVWAQAEGSSAAPAQTVRLAAGANPPLRFGLPAR